MDISDHCTHIQIGDLLVALAALRLLWDLEDRGLDLRIAADGRLHVTPAARLKPTDGPMIRVHRDALRALISICEQVP
jgi:hypothetical protein